MFVLKIMYVLFIRLILEYFKNHYILKTIKSHLQMSNLVDLNYFFCIKFDLTLFASIFCYLPNPVNVECNIGVTRVALTITSSSKTYNSKL